MNKTIKLMLLSLTLFLAGCSKDKEPAPTDHALNVVATTTMIADLATVIGGDAIQVNGLMGPGIDPHLYQASAGDVSTMQNADIIIYNGFGLEGKLGDIFSSLSNNGKTIIRLEDGITKEKLLQSEDGYSTYDPHIWFDVSLWSEAAQHVANELTLADPDNATTYKENYQAYKIELDELDSYVQERVNEIDESKRVLITAHDAFRYLGSAYGFQVMGLQGISTTSEASTSDLKTLSDYIVSNKIPAIFVETSIPTKNIEALQDAVAAKGSNIIIGGELYSDSLGDIESNTHTYLLTVRSNIDRIIDGLKR